MTPTNRLIAAVGFALAALAVLVLGVSRALDDGTVPYPQTGCTLTGRVTYNGAPVPLVLVIVASAKGGGANALANEAGEFVIENVPPGPITIGFNSEAARGIMIGRAMAGSDPTKAGGKRAPLPKLVELPRKYQTPDTSGLGCTIERGDNKQDFAIKG